MMGRQENQIRNDLVPNNQTAGSGFSGSRLKQLQLARSRASRSMEEASSKPDAFRRWQSMNETTRRANLINANDEMASVSSSSSLNPRGATSLRHRTQGSQDGPVVYVLPERKSDSYGFLYAPNRPTLTSDSHNSQRSLDQRVWPAVQTVPSPHQKLREDLKLKYPHGMPRWGPRLVSATPVSAEEDRQDPMRDYISNIGGYQVVPPSVPDPEKDHSVDSTGRKSSAKSRQEAVVEKARTQSLLAAARAAQNVMAATHSPSTKTCSPTNHTTPSSTPSVGLTSKLLGRRSCHREPSSSLLQSARLQQFKVMHASDQLRHPSISVDGPSVQQHRGMKGSVTTLEDLPRPTAPRTVSEAPSNSHNSASDNHDEWDDNEDDDNSWDMETHHDRQDEPGAASQEASSSSESERPEEEEEEANYYEEQRSSIPTLIHSEVDHETSSQFSDFSSLAVNTRRDASHPQGDEDYDNNIIADNQDEPYEEEFFDSAGSIRTCPTEYERRQRFDFRRCNELLSRRNLYLEKEERKQLISPQAAIRLANTPALSRTAADDKAWQELASRGRWHLLQQKHEYKVTIPKALHRPLASLTDEDESRGVKPISLVAPNTLTTPVNISKNMWHKPKSNIGDDKEGDDDGENNATLVERNGNGATTKMKLPSTIKKFSVRCIPILLIFLWAKWAYESLCSLFLIKALSLGRTLHDKSGMNTYSWKASFQKAEVMFLNASQFSDFPGTTDRALPEVLVPVDARLSFHHTPSLTCEANEKIVNFWKITYEFEENDAALPENNSHDEILQSLSVEIKNSQQQTLLNSMFLIDMVHDQTNCDEVLAMCFHACYRTSYDNPQEAVLSLEDSQFVQEEEPIAKKDIHMSLYLDQYNIGDGDDDSAANHPLKKFALALQRDFGAVRIRDKHVILDKIGDVLRTNAQNLPNNKLFIDSDNTFFHKVGRIMQKSSQNLHKVDPFNDFDDLASGGEQLLEAFVGVLRKPAENLKAKRQKRRKIYHV